MNVVLFDDPDVRRHLLPFTYTRPVAGIRVGIWTIAEKWAQWLSAPVAFQTEPYLSARFPGNQAADKLLINGALCPDDVLVATIKSIPDGYFLVKGTTLLAARNPVGQMNSKNTIEYLQDVTLIDRLWKIFRENGEQLRLDYARITQGRKSAPISDPHTKVYEGQGIFLEEGVTIKAAILNAEYGPIYLGRNSTVLEGAIIRGAFALCEESQVNVGAKIRGDVTVGPYSKVGGEVSNSVVFAYSNKAHDGFLGNSVIGEWCNIGADTNTSNLRNNYDTVKLWDHAAGDYVQTGLQFCGLMMGDHSKCSINTMFNTATVVDFCSNVFGHGFPAKYIPSFAWGGADGFTTFDFEKAIETNRRVMARRNIALDPVERAIQEHLFQLTASHRNWEKS
jgi:UDP-N-acetylglucosamine diphosphorylase/glucosamine-1-phosphate N-acetyltransferase